MCGIAGIIGQADELVDAADVRRMCKTIIHRGPDDEGIYAVGPIGLGMRRLSIIDLAGGRQPVHNEDKSIWVVFNGEIYNFPDLRRELEARGHNFYTHTDTEVIVHGYKQWGEDVLNHLKGMFGLAIWDAVRRRLIIARDPQRFRPIIPAAILEKLTYCAACAVLLVLGRIPIIVALGGAGDFVLGTLFTISYFRLRAAHALQ